MIFSNRYFRALEQKTLAVELPEVARRKLWSWLDAHNMSFAIRRDPNDSWIDNSSLLEETLADLSMEHGWNALPVAPTVQGDPPFSDLRDIFLEGNGAYVFDAIELASSMMEPAQREEFRQKANQIFELHGCPWRLSDGEFFKLDSDFVGARLAMSAHDALAANRFAGAADEYAKARQYLGAGEIRDAINYAGHSFESVMKVLTNIEHANADRLIKGLAGQGFFDDLPEAMRAGFTDQVLKSLPFLRNKLGGHGQGADVLTIPQCYGDLAVQLAAAFHNFLITKHLERIPTGQPSQEIGAAISSPDDDIPF